MSTPHPAALTSGADPVIRHGTAALNKGGFAEINSVSCTPAGTCNAGGGSVTGLGIGRGHAFVDSRT